MRYPTEHLYPRGSYSFSTTSTDFDYAIANTSHEGHLVESRVTIFGIVSHLQMMTFPNLHLKFDEAIALVGSFPFVSSPPPPGPVRYAPSVTEHVPLHSKSLYKNMARAAGGAVGANNMHPLS